MKNEGHLPRKLAKVIGTLVAAIVAGMSYAESRGTAIVYACSSFETEFEDGPCYGEATTLIS